MEGLAVGCYLPREEGEVHHPAYLGLAAIMVRFPVELW